MSYQDEERRPLLPQDDYSNDNVHDQFCQLVGVPPSDLPAGKKWHAAGRTLYERATQSRSNQGMTYKLTASFANTLLLSQVVIGAAVTGMGASGTDHIYITLLGAANTIIAGLVAYLKSRGQPMRARMFRDDLERVVDEIENSEVMWLGISKHVNGYDDIDTEDQVTVRSEVARLTRLYDKAVRNHTMNNPDLYGSGDTGSSSAALKNKTAPAPAPLPPGPATAAPVAAEPTSPVAAPVADTPLVSDPDESPATAKPTVPAVVKTVVSETGAKEDGNAKGGDGDAKKDDSTEDAVKEDQTKQDIDDTAGKSTDGPADDSKGKSQDKPASNKASKRSTRPDKDINGDDSSNAPASLI